jgi:GT2 family glycosyltransferase
MSAAPDEAKITAIVVTYRTGPILFECLDRLAGEARIGEVIVVDNGNPEAVLAALKARPVTLVSGHGNIGFARGANLGAKRARENYLAFINPDALIDPGALAAMMEAGRSVRAPWIVGARLVGADGREQRGARRAEITLWSAAVSGLGLGRLARLSAAFSDPHLEREALPCGPQRVAAVSGAAMAMRRADFERLGGFDERYFLHADDLDICRRAREAGGDVIFQPDARVMHVGATSGVSALFVAHAKAIALNQYFWKFARGPLEKAACLAAAPFIYALILAGGAIRSIRR